MFLKGTLKEGEGWVCYTCLPPRLCKHDRELCDDCAVEQLVEDERERIIKIIEDYPSWAKGYYEVCEAVPHLVKKLREGR